MLSVSVTIRIHMYLNRNPKFLLFSSASVKFRRQIKTGNNYLGVIQLYAIVRTTVKIFYTGGFV